MRAAMKGQLARSLIRTTQFSRTFSSAASWEDTIHQFWERKLPVDKALKSLQEMVTKQEDLTKLGQYCTILHEQKRWAGLEGACKRAQELDKNSLLPSIFGSLYKLATKEDSKDALEVIKKIREHTPKPIESRCLAVLYSKLGRNDAALRHLNAYYKSGEGEKDVLALYDKMTLEMSCRRFDEGLKSCDEILAHDKKNSGTRFNKCLALKGLNQNNEAIVELTLLISETQDNAYKSTLYRHRAQCRGYGDTEQKAADLIMSHKLCPESGCEKDIVSAYYEGEKFEMAEKWLNSVDEKKVEKDVDLCLMKGDLYRFHLKDYAKAAVYYTKALNVAGENMRPHLRIQIELLKKLAEKNPMKAARAKKSELPKANATGQA